MWLANVVAVTVLNGLDETGIFTVQDQTDDHARPFFVFCSMRLERSPKPVDDDLLLPQRRVIKPAKGGKKLRHRLLVHPSLRNRTSVAVFAGCDDGVDVVPNVLCRHGPQPVCDVLDVGGQAVPEKDVGMVPPDPARAVDGPEARVVGLLVVVVDELVE